MNLNDCYNFDDFRRLAKKNLPAPIFHYIDGGSDDETTLKRMREEIRRDMILLGCKSIKELNSSKIAYR